MSPNISLEKLVPSDEDQVDNLESIGLKLAKLYQTADKMEFADTDALEESITNIAKSAKDARYGEVAYRRLFIQSMCEGLDLLSKEVEIKITSEMSNNLVKNIGIKLTTEEEDTDDESEDKAY